MFEVVQWGQINMEIEGKTSSHPPNIQQQEMKAKMKKKFKNRKTLSHNQKRKIGNATGK